MKSSTNLKKRCHAQNGSAVVLVFAMLIIMTILVAVNTVTIRTLSRELKFLEKKQTKRLQNLSSSNAVPVGVKISNPPQHD